MATISGTTGNDSLAGTSSADSITGSAGNDSIDGLGGNDTAHGGSGDDNVRGGGGSDLLRGNGGTDVLNGGLGVDNLGGGTEADIFAFSDMGAANADTIADFVSGEDVIQLDGTLFTGIGASGFFVANASGTAQDADDRIIFETDTRQVWYDADGSGAGARQLVATLQVGGTLAASDITVVGGTPPGNVINGTEGDDTLVGTPDNDTINGLGGNDFIDGGGFGDDLLDGGAGDDEIDSFGESTVIGGAGNDTITGDEVFGGDGNDLLNFERLNGDNLLDGGAGNDFYWATAGDVLVDAGGIDTVVTNESWTLAAGFENLNFRNFTLRDDGLPGLVGTGNELANRMSTYAGDGGTLDGRDGNDTLIGGFRGADTLIGGAGNDVLTGDLLADSFVFNVAPGAANADQITDFTSGSDRLVLDGTAFSAIGASGGFDAGDARFAANASGIAQDASDRVIFETDTGQVWYDADGSGAGARQLIATLQSGATLVGTDIEVINGANGADINGTAGNDTLTGTSAAEVINGLGGNDTVVGGGGGGDDTINGGDGRDSIEFKSAAASELTVDWGTGTIIGVDGTITFTSIERIAGGSFADVFVGDGAAQNLTGQGGSDTLWGAGGLDTLWGGNGEDIFLFREMGTANADRISDFVSGSDEVHLDDAAFAALGPIGAFSVGDARFWSSAEGTAHDADDRVIYDTTDGNLYYDADGSGAGAAQLIATVAGAPALVATDIWAV